VSVEYSRIRNKFVMRLCLDEFCEFSEFVESITCDLSMASQGSNPTLTAKHRNPRRSADPQSKGHTWDNEQKGGAYRASCDPMYQASSSLRRTAGSSDAGDSNSRTWKDYVHIHALSPRCFNAPKGLAPKAEPIGPSI